MQLQSIHVSLPKTIIHEGVEVTTGIFKELVTGPVKVERLHLAGDGQADLRVHGGVNKAVYAYPAQHYPFWETTRPDLQFGPGAFGENLSITGLDETDVCIGDRFKIGSATFAVTGPRMPCYKLGIKMGDPSFLGDFTDARKSGFYFKVLEEGTIEAGDPIEALGGDDYGLTVEQVVYTYVKGRRDRARLEFAINSPSLPEDWIDYFERMLVRL